MTSQEINHVKDCKELMQEIATKAGLIVILDEYVYGEKFNKGIEIKLRDKDGYLIYKSYGSIDEIIGFLKGYMYNKAE